MIKTMTVKTLKPISKFFHILVILSFFAPFITFSCGPSANELAEKAKQDSIRVADSIAAIHGNAIQIKDTSKVEKIILVEKDSVKLDDTLVSENSIMNQLDTVDKPIQNNKKFENKNLTERISTKFGFLRNLLIPDDEYTGVGYIIDGFNNYIIFGGVITAFIFLLIGFILRF
jgi:hypothetical protein